MAAVLDEQLRMLDQSTLVELRGRVTDVRGLALRVADLPVPIGSSVRVRATQGSGRTVQGEVVGFEGDETIVMLLGQTVGVRRGDAVIADQFAQNVRVGRSLLGRVLNGMCEPIDGRGGLADTVTRPLHTDPVQPLRRPMIDRPLSTGVRAIDGLITIGRGQRVGVFAGPGVGKSTLIGMMARHTAADVTVIALVGERGREVKDFIKNHLGDEGMARAVVVCATSDEPALMRIRCAYTATAIAEYFRDAGKDVLLIMDSVTRLCQAQRQVGLSAGEPPTTRGYPPSVFAMLPTILERSGRTEAGSITGFYSVLTEGDELTDPITDACRGILDGHVQLSLDLAQSGHWPAIDVMGSISRLAGEVTGPDQQAHRQEVIQMLSTYRQVEDLLNVGAYASGSNAGFDAAIACKPAIDQLLRQGRSEAGGGIEKTCKQLGALAQRIRQVTAQLSKPPRQAVRGPGG